MGVVTSVLVGFIVFMWWDMRQLQHEQMMRYKDDQSLVWLPKPRLPQSFDLMLSCAERDEKHAHNLLQKLRTNVPTMSVMLSESEQRFEREMDRLDRLITRRGGSVSERGALPGVQKRESLATKALKMTSFRSRSDKRLRLPARRQGLAGRPIPEHVTKAAKELLLRHMDHKPVVAFVLTKEFFARKHCVALLRAASESVRAHHYALLMPRAVESDKKRHCRRLCDEEDHSGNLVNDFVDYPQKVNGMPNTRGEGELLHGWLKENLRELLLPESGEAGIADVCSVIPYFTDKYRVNVTLKRVVQHVLHEQFDAEALWPNAPHNLPALSISGEFSAIKPHLPPHVRWILRRTHLKTGIAQKPVRVRVSKHLYMSPHLPQGKLLWAKLRRCLGHQLTSSDDSLKCTHALVVLAGPASVRDEHYVADIVRARNDGLELVVLHVGNTPYAQHFLGDSTDKLAAVGLNDPDRAITCPDCAFYETFTEAKRRGAAEYEDEELEKIALMRVGLALQRGVKLTKEGKLKRMASANMRKMARVGGAAVQLVGKVRPRGLTLSLSSLPRIRSDSEKSNDDDAFGGGSGEQASEPAQSEDARLAGEQKDAATQEKQLSARAPEPCELPVVIAPDRAAAGEGSRTATAGSAPSASTKAVLPGEKNARNPLTFAGAVTLDTALKDKTSPQSSAAQQPGQSTGPATAPKPLMLLKVKDGSAQYRGADATLNPLHRARSARNGTSSEDDSGGDESPSGDSDGNESLSDEKDDSEEGDEEKYGAEPDKERGAGAGAQGVPSASPSRLRGLLQKATANLVSVAVAEGQKLGFTLAGEDPSVIAYVAEGGVAELAGLQVGSALLRIGGVDVSSKGWSECYDMVTLTDRPTRLVFSRAVADTTAALAEVPRAQRERVTALLKAVRGAKGSLDLAGKRLGELSTEAWQVLAPAIESNSAIAVLVLRNNNLGTLAVEAWQLLARVLERSKSITSLGLQDNNLGALPDTTWRRLLAPALERNCSVTTLNLRNNGLRALSHSAWMLLSRAFERNATLTTLWLQNNDLDQLAGT
eukprot:g6848.t1